MKDELLTLLRQIHHEYLDSRNLDRLIQGTNLEEVYKKADEKRQKELVDFLKKKNKLRIVRWLKAEENKELGMMTVRQLRTVASSMRIFSYGEMTKGQLLASIRRERHDKADIVTRDL